MRFRSSKKEIAQAAIEVAAFGAILLFVLSVIVRQSFNANFGQNQSLRALRMAMTASYNTSFMELPARNTASVIIVEDHMSPGLHKYGSDARTPFVISATATHSSQLFMPMTYNERDELPRVDFYVNGQHFQFTVAGFKTVENLNSTSDPDWDPNCASRLKWDGAAFTIPETIGCRRLYMTVPNYMADSNKNKFCCQDEGLCSSSRCSVTSNRCCLATNIPTVERFDLDRNPATNNAAGLVPSIPSSFRENFAWQWYLVQGFAPYMSRPQTGGAPIYDPENSSIIIGYTLVPFRANFGDIIIWEPKTNSSPERKDNIVLDIDKDLKEETILEADFDQNGVLIKAYLLDQQDGDMDFTRGTAELGPRPGLGDDLKMYTFIRDTSSSDGGTYLQIDEGKLFEGTGDDRQIYRTVQKRDKVDLIERTIQLSNDTGRFCDWATMSPWPEVDKGTRLEHDNPIEACADNCFQATGTNITIDKTCYFQGQNIIYVRSRLQDLGGKKWVTPVIP